MPSNLIKEAEAQAIVSGSMSGVLQKIVSYLETNLGINFVRIPGIESFKNSKEAGTGIRFVFGGTTKSLRFNWHSESQVGKADAIMSIDVWNGTQRDPSKNIKTKDGESFMQVLPHLANAINPAEHVTEAKKGEFTPETALNDFILRLRKGKTFTRGDFIQFYHNENVDVFDTLVSRFGNQITLVGKRVAAKRGTDWDKLKKDVLTAASNTLMIDDAGTGEEYDDMQDESGVTFTDSLKHLAELTKGVAKGTFNALFVAGKGGTGKTQTVTAALSAAGLKEDENYVKISGSATAAGIYTLLYKHHDDVILFDDADGALDDVDARNLIKAATDTKKVRKLSWMKAGSITSKDGRLVPPAFNFEGRIIFISNLSLDKLDPDKSIRTRAFIIVINPTNDEMVEYMREILPKIPVAGNLNMKARQKVLSVVKEVGATNDVNLRTLVRALNLCASGALNWEQLVRLYA